MTISNDVANDITMPVSTSIRNLSLVEVSDSDRAAGTTSYATVQAAVETFQRDGVCAITNAIDTGIVDALNKKMVSETEEYVKRPGAHFNQGKAARNISQCPPLQKEWMFQQIWANPHALAALEYILGPEPELHFVNSNVALQNHNPLARQAVHSDAYHDHPHYPWCAVVNIYLCAVSAENGSTEMWPGTQNYNKSHHIGPDNGWIRQDVFNEQAKLSPPLQPTLPKGTIVIRDMRTWHAGMPNMTPDPRVMLTFVYFPKFWRSPMKISLPANVRASVAAWPKADFEAGTKWIDGEIDHLGLQFEANWTQEEAGSVGGGGEGVISKATGVPVEPIVTRENYWVSGVS